MGHFEDLMAKKSDTELTDILNDIDRYTPAASIAVINELKKRGRNFSDEEVKLLEEKNERKKLDEEQGTFRSSKSLRKNIVTDPNAPLLYSAPAIMIFSSIFTVLFGAVLLSLNIEDKNNKLKVIGFGVLFTSLAIALGNLVPHPTLYVLSINSIGGYFLTSDFWNKYLGRETKYRAKPIWIPLLISISITVVLLGMMIYGKK